MLLGAKKRMAESQDRMFLKYHTKHICDNSPDTSFLPSLLSGLSTCLQKLFSLNSCSSVLQTQDVANVKCWFCRTKGRKLFLLSYLPGEVEEMEHQNGEQESQEKGLETGSGQSEDETGKEGWQHRKHLFSFSLVNSYGTTEINSLTTEGKILKLNCRYLFSRASRPYLIPDRLASSNSPGSFSAHATIAIDWDSDTRKSLFDEQEAQVIHFATHTHT